jgi:hypothetical protein
MQEMRRALERRRKDGVPGLSRELADLVTARGELADLADVAGGSGDLPAVGRKALGKRLGRKAEAERE